MTLGISSALYCNSPTNKFVYLHDAEENSLTLKES